jgi:hypothetical protein
MVFNKLYIFIIFFVLLGLGLYFFLKDKDIVKECNPKCQINQKCVDGNCQCKIEWTGGNCNIKRCKNDCSGNGQCVKGKCICNKYYYGKSCSLSTCDYCGGCDNEKTCSIGYTRPYLNQHISTMPTAVACAKRATDNNYKNWSFDTSITELNCRIGTLPESSCVQKSKGFISDTEAEKSTLCSFCELTKTESIYGKPCTLNTDCGNKEKCQELKCEHDYDCLFTSNTKCNMETKLCEKGACDNSYCETTNDCPSLTGLECIQNKCILPSIYGLSCGMNKGFIPNTEQNNEMTKVCQNKSFNDDCSIDFGNNGIFKGNCGVDCSDDARILKCYQPKICMPDDNTSVSNLKGICVDTIKNTDVQFSTCK